MKDELKTTFIFSTHDHKIVENAEIIYTLEDGLVTGVREVGRKQ
jgi:putative ABC transport system ATP-binding protein